MPLSLYHKNDNPLPPKRKNKQCFLIILEKLAILNILLIKMQFVTFLCHCYWYRYTCDSSTRDALWSWLNLILRGQTRGYFKSKAFQVNYFQSSKLLQNTFFLTTVWIFNPSFFQMEWQLYHSILNSDYKYKNVYQRIHSIYITVSSSGMMSLHLVLLIHYNY